MSPYREVHQREAELGRQLTLAEHIEIIERRLWTMRIRFYFIVGMLVAAVLIGGTASFYVYGQAQDEAIRTTCEQANARWFRLRENLITNALQRRPMETDAEYKARRMSTLALLEGLFDIDCSDPSKRVPAPLPSGTR